MIQSSHFFGHIKRAFRLRSILYRGVILMLLSGLTLSVMANQFYRYKNENGVLVLTQTLPAQYVDKGYDILNLKGRVIKTVPPALTPEEIAARDAAIEQERLAQIEKQKQDAIDEELKQLYSQPNDAVRVLSRRIADIESVIEIKRSKIQNIENLIMDEESYAAERQRKGLSVGEESLLKIESFKKEIAQTKSDINALYLELNKVLIEFDAKIKRLQVITGIDASDYPAVLESANSLLDSK